MGEPLGVLEDVNPSTLILGAKQLTVCGDDVLGCPHICSNIPDQIVVGRCVLRTIFGQNIGKVPMVFVDVADVRSVFCSAFPNWVKCCTGRFSHSESNRDGYLTLSCSMFIAGDSQLREAAEGCKGR